MRLTHFLKEGKGITAIIGILLIFNVFVIGYLSGFDKSRLKPVIFESKTVIIEKEKEVSEISQNDGKTLVASKSGTRVYYVWCTGVSRIKTENKVYFDTLEDALKKGYKPASNCPGM